MSPCSFLAPNGENSLLYAALEQNLGENKATLLWHQIQSEEFKQQHGDWSDQKPEELKASSDYPMKYKMPAGANRTGKDTSTIDLIEQGLRTATTRSKPLGKAGDIITFEGRPQKYRITGVEKLTQEKVEDPAWIEKWSQKEQWTTQYFKDIVGKKPTVRVGSYQTSFEKVSDTTTAIPLDKNGEPTYEWVKDKLGLDKQSVKVEEPKQAEPVKYSIEDLTATTGKDKLSEQSITASINKIYDEASANPEKIYHLDLPGDPKQKIKLGDKTSMSVLKLAALIDSREIPYNIKLSDDFNSILQNTPRRFLGNLMYQDHSTYHPLPYDESVLQRQIEQEFVPIRDDSGRKTGGVFDSERQSEVVDSTIHALHLMMKKAEDMRKSFSVDDFRKLIKNNVFEAFRNNYQKVAEGQVLKGYEDVTAEQAAKLVDEFNQVLRSFDAKDGLNFWNLAMQRMKDYKINIRDNNFKTSQDTTKTDELSPIEGSGFQEEAGHGLSDWSDMHFEKDPRDTASGRMHMFVATVVDSVVGDEESPREVSFSFNNPETRDKITSGHKIFTVRTPEQASRIKLDKEGAEATAKINSKTYRITALRQADATDVDVHGAAIKAEEGVDMKQGDWMYRIEPFVPKQAVLKPNKNYLGLPKLVDFEQLYSDAMGKLSEQTDKTIDNYINILEQEGNKYNPNLRALAEKLKTAPKELQNEFTSVMSMANNQFTMVLLDSRKDSNDKQYFVLRPINANRGSQLNVLIENWQQNQKFSPMLKRNAANITVIDANHAAKLKADLDTVNAMYTKGDKLAHNKAVELLHKVLESNGITMPDEAIKAFIKDAARWTKKTSLQGDFRRQFAVTEDGRPLGVISSIIQKLIGKDTDSDALDTLEDKSYQLNNPLYTEGTTLNILARVAAAYTPALYSNTHRSSEGKTIYDYGFNTALSNAVRKLRTDNAYLQKFNDVDIAKNSFLLTRVKNNQGLRDKIGLTYLDGIKAVYMPSASGTVRPQMSEREQILTALGLFQNRGDSRSAHYFSLTHSDKTTTPLLMNMPRIAEVTVSKIVDDKLGGKVVKAGISEEAMNELMNVFYSEYDRKVRAAQNSYNNPKYEEGSQHFYFLPQFNHDRMKAMVKNGEIPEGVLNALWNEDGTMKHKDGPKFKDAVQLLLRRHIDNLTANTLHEWRKHEIISDGNTPFDRKYMNRLLRGYGVYYQKNRVDQLGQAAGNGYVDRNNLPVGDNDAHNLAATLAARDYAINSYLMNVSMSQILYGDPAETWKGSVDKTMVEYGKRLAGPIAPGQEGAWKPGETFTSITAKDFKTNAKYLGEIESLKKAYADGNPLEGSDAQELTTVQEHLDVMHAYGRISDKVYMDMSKIIRGAEGSYYEFTDPLHKQVIMQAMKPVYFGDRAPENGAILHDYIKSSAYPLYPPFTIGKQLDKLRGAMEVSGIARLNFESAKKIGVPGKPVAVFNPDGTTNDKVFISPEWTGKDEHGTPMASARQVLSREGFRIQQEVPYDEEKESIRTVSQMNKLIVQGIPEIKTPFSYDGRQVTAGALMDARQEIRKKLFEKNQERLFDEIGADLSEDGKSIVLSDKTKLFDALQKRILQGDTGFTANDLAYFTDANKMPHSDDLIIPLMYAPSSSKFESLLMSMVSEISNIQMPGRSYIQASPAGHQSIGKFEDMSEEAKKNIIWTEGYQGGPLKTLSKDGPAQVLVPFNFLVNGKQADITKYIKTLDDGRRVIDNDKIPKELLQLVGARIPNQGHNSMLPIEIVGFVPPKMGDLMIVPAAITKQMGSDFDVDKLYTYRRAYKHIDGKFYEEAEGENGLKNAYFDIHWSVLNHPEMLERVLKPLDKPDLKDEAAQIEKWEQKTDRPMDFYDPQFQLHDFMAQKDAKQLVARASLSTTFNAVIQDKNIQPGYITMSKDDGIVNHVVPIKIIDEDGTTRYLSTLSGYGQSKYGDEIRTKHDNHTTQQSEFLDYAKNRISDKVHLNTYTYAASAALSQLQTPDENGTNGWAANLKYNARLLSQPIVKEYAAEMAKRGDSLSSGYDPDLKRSVISSLIAKYKDAAEKAGESQPDKKDIISFQDLTDALSKPDKISNYKQIQAIQLFEQLDQIGSEMTKAQGTINHDTQGAGASLLDLMSQRITRNRMELPIGSSYRKLALLGAEGIYHEGQRQTEQGRLYSMIHDAAFSIVGEFFPYEKMMPAFEHIMQHTKREDGLVSDIQKRVFNAAKSYIFSHPQLGLWENPEATRATLLYKRGDTPSLAERVQVAKNTWGQNNYFLQRLQTEVDPDNLHPSTVKYLASKASTMDESENTRAFIDLLRSEDPEQRRLGEDLVRYAYITGGLQDANSFVKYIPYSYLIGTDFGYKLRDLTDRMEDVMMSENYITQLYQHYPQMALALSPKFEEVGGLENYPERFVLPEINPELSGSDDNPNPAANLIINKTTPFGRVDTYPDFLSYRAVKENKWILYKRTTLADGTDTGYIRIDTLGDKNIDEYSVNEGLSRRSLIPENRSKAYDNITPSLRMLNGAFADPGAKKVQEDLHMPSEGNEEELRKVLQNISGDDTIPNHLRIVSDFLSKLHFDGPNHAAIKHTAAGSFEIPDFSFEVVHDTDKFNKISKGGPFAAFMDSYRRKLYIDPTSMHDKTRTAELINHELIHGHTALLTMMGEPIEYLRRRFGDEAARELKNQWEHFSKQYPEARKAVEALDEVRQQAQERLKEMMARKGYFHPLVAEQVRSGDLSNPFATLVYATESNTEFITHAMTNLGTMRFLNMNQYRGESQNFLSRVMSIVRSMISAIGTALGVNVEKNSLLDKSLQRSLELMTLNKAYAPSVAELSTPNNMAAMLTHGALHNPVITAVDRIVGKLDEQREEIVHSLTGRLTKEEAADKRVKLDQIEQDIKRLREDADLSLVGEIGKRHLQWVDTVLKQEKPTATQIMTSNRVLEVWNNLVDLVYGEGSNADNVDPNFAEIQSNAQRLRSRLAAKSQDTLKELSAGVLQTRDFNTTNLTDIDKAQGFLRDLPSAATSKVTQYIGSFMETVARHRDEDNVRLRKWIDKWEEDAAIAAGGKKNLKDFYDKFMQKNSDGTAWGLVQRYSQNWYDFRRSLRGRRSAEINRIDKSGYTREQAAKLKQQAWSDYWREINKAAVFADTRLLFDQDTGELKTDERATAHKAELEKEIGSDATNELIDQAQKRYKQYLEHKQANSDNIDAEVAAGNMTAEDANSQKTAFVHRYSPNVFFNNFKSKLSEFRDVNTDYYTKMAPRRYQVDNSGSKPKLSETEFYDNKFEAIQSDPRMKKLYDDFAGKLRELKEQLPIHIQQQMGANFLPYVHKSLLADLLSNGVEYIKTLDERAIKSLTASEYEEDLNSRKYSKIPLDYVDEEKTPLEDRSKDLGGILTAFGLMANHYKHFADAKDYIDMGEALLQEIDRARTSGAAQQIEKGGKITTVRDGLRNTLDVLKFMKDALMYKKSRQLEGKSETKIYSANPLKQYKITHEVKDLIAEREKINRQIIDGDLDPGEGLEKLKAIDKKLEDPKYKGRTLYGSKIGDTLIKFNYQKTLSFNPFSGLNNVLFGLISARIHANGKKDFTHAELGAAYKTISHSFLKWASFGSIESKQAYKMLAIMDRAGIIGDYIEGGTGHLKIRDKRPGWWKAVNPYNFMRSGDYFMKALTTKAMLLHDKVDVVEDGVAKKISLWDALDDEGNWNSKKYGVNEKWSAEDNTKSTSWDKWRNKALKVNMIIHGNQDRNAPKYANNFILGRLLGQFRMSWLPEGWYSRFQKEHYDIDLGRDVKGRYRSYASLGLGGSFHVIMRQMMSIVSKVDPYTGMKRLDGKPLSDVDIENLRRNFAELGYIVGLTALYMGAKSLVAQDDDHKRLFQFTTNMLLRSQQDLTFYSTPMTFDNITRNIIPATQVITDGWKAVKATGRVMTDSDYEYQQWLKQVFKAGLPLPQATLVPKTEYMINKDLGNLQH